MAIGARPMYVEILTHVLTPHDDIRDVAPRLMYFPVHLLYK
jgi:hypothetical protein